MSTLSTPPIEKARQKHASKLWGIWVLPCLGVAGYAIVRYLIMPPSQGHYSSPPTASAGSRRRGGGGLAHWAVAILDVASQHALQMASLARTHPPGCSCRFIGSRVYFGVPLRRRMGHPFRIRVAGGYLVLHCMDGLYDSPGEPISPPLRVDAPKFRPDARCCDAAQ